MKQLVKLNFTKMTLAALLVSNYAMAQDSALSAAPGTPPPPQGWGPPPPDGGIHLPRKKKPKIRLENKPSEEKAPAVSPTPASHL